MKDSKKAAGAASVQDEPSAGADTQTHGAPGHSPIWKTQSGRVQGAMFKHDQKGKVRYTVSISRSFRDKNDDWHNVHFFDRDDLADVKAVADQAVMYLAEVMDKVEA